MKFEITDKEQAVIDEWIEGLYQEQIDILTKNNPTYHEIAEPGEVYYGAIGGNITYEFIPTSLGVILVVHDQITNKDLNVTDAMGWENFG